MKNFSSCSPLVHSYSCFPLSRCYNEQDNIGTHERLPEMVKAYFSLLGLVATGGMYQSPLLSLENLHLCCLAIECNFIYSQGLFLFRCQCKIYIDTCSKCCLISENFCDCTVCYHSRCKTIITNSG